MDQVYLDNHSTTRVDPRVVEAMLPAFTEIYGNPSSRNHAFGWQAEELAEKGREEVAALIGADPKEIVFTSGMTGGMLYRAAISRTFDIPPSSFLAMRFRARRA